MSDPFVNPFPGMNPYLETLGLWPDVHNRLIGAVSSFLRRNLPIRYSVVTEERVVIGHNPPEEPRRRYAIPDVSISSDAVAPSPEGHARNVDLRAVSATHLVEIDLVRAGDPMPVEGYSGDAPYNILVSRNELRPSAELYPFGVQSRIPDIVVPLLNDEDEPTLRLGELVRDIYLQDLYGRLVNYHDDPTGPLSVDDRGWIDRILREKGLRE